MTPILLPPQGVATVIILIATIRNKRIIFEALRFHATHHYASSESYWEVVVMGSSTCTKILVRAVHAKGRQALTSPHKCRLGRTGGFNAYAVSAARAFLALLPKETHSHCLLGDSGGVVNSLDFCQASLNSLVCFYFRSVLSSQWKAVTVKVHCQL